MESCISGSFNLFDLMVMSFYELIQSLVIRSTCPCLKYLKKIRLSVRSAAKLFNLVNTIYEVTYIYFKQCLGARVVAAEL